MGFISAVRSAFDISATVREEIWREVDFYEAVETHLAWKIRLTDYLQGRGKGELQAQHIGVDDQCVLGQWIHGAGKARFGEAALFQELREEHAKFHAHAAQVVETYQSGNRQRAQQILLEDFAHQSKKTMKCLTQMHMQIEGNS